MGAQKAQSTVETLMFAFVTSLYLFKGPVTEILDKNSYMLVLKILQLFPFISEICCLMTCLGDLTY